MKANGHKIERLQESFSSEVLLTLKNGVRVLISSNKGYVHVHFSGVEVPIEVEERAANNLNVRYKAARESE